MSSSALSSELPGPVDTAMRLARYFGTDARFWLNLQNAYDIETADAALIVREVLPAKTQSKK